jgi:hypothetical protein
MAAGLVSRSASKVNVEVANSTYLPADAAFKNPVEPRDDVLLVVAAKHRRRAIKRDYPPRGVVRNAG